MNSRQSFEYVSNTLILREGGRILRTFPGISELNVLDSNCLQTISGGAVGTVFGGPGTLYTNGGNAFYTTLPGVQTEITEQIVGNQLKFNYFYKSIYLLIMPEYTLGQVEGVT